tara:strand:- start:89 stop:229 length:141 start_codon:yes stop_codon:yes gene_type:complete
MFFTYNEEKQYGLLKKYVGRIFIFLNKKLQFVIRDSWLNKKNDNIK